MVNLRLFALASSIESTDLVVRVTWVLETTVAINKDDILDQCIRTRVLDVDVGGTIGMHFWRAIGQSPAYELNSLQENNTPRRGAGV